MQEDLLMTHAKSIKMTFFKKIRAIIYDYIMYFAILIIFVLPLIIIMLL